MEQCYQLSKDWVVRSDQYALVPYSLYNIHTEKELTINRSVFNLLSYLENRGHTVQELGNYFGLEPSEAARIVRSIADTFPTVLEEGSVVRHYSILPFRGASPVVPLYNAPKSVEILLTEYCNLACRHCVHSCSKKSSSASLSASQWISIFKDLEQNRVTRAVITGGEIFTHPGIDSIVAALPNLRIRFFLLTNAMLIDEKRAELLKAPNVVLSISLDGGDAESHDFLRGKGAFAVLGRNLDLLTKYGVSKYLSMTIHARNYDQLEAMVRYAIEKECRSANFILLDPVGRASQNSDIHLNREQRKYCKEEVRRLVDKYSRVLPIVLLDPSGGTAGAVGSTDPEFAITCTGTISHMAINPLGDAYPCVYAFGMEELKAGNLLQTPLNVLWSNSPEWNVLRGGIRMKDLHICNTCKLKATCLLKNCRIRALKYNGDLYGRPNCIA